VHLIRLPKCPPPLATSADCGVLYIYGVEDSCAAQPSANDAVQELGEGADGTSGDLSESWTLVRSRKHTLRVADFKGDLTQLMASSQIERDDFCRAVAKPDMERAASLYREIVGRNGPTRNPLGLLNDSVLILSQGSILAEVTPIKNVDAANDILNSDDDAAILNAFCVYRAREQWDSLASDKIVAAISHIPDKTDAYGTFVTAYPLPQDYTKTHDGRTFANRVGCALAHFTRHCHKSTPFFLYADKRRAIDFRKIFKKTPESADECTDYAINCINELAASSDLQVEFHGGSQCTVLTPSFLLFAVGHGVNAIAQDTVKQMLDRCTGAPQRGDFSVAAGADAISATVQKRDDIVSARRLLRTVDVLPMVDAPSRGVSTRQRVHTLIANRLEPLRSGEPVSPSAVLSLRMARLNRAMEQRLMPIAEAMDLHGSHGVSMSQLLRQVVNGAFKHAPPGDPLAGDDLLVNQTGVWFGTPVLRVDAKDFLRKKKKGQDLLEQLPADLKALVANDPGEIPEGVVRLYRATSVESASQMLEDLEVDLSIKEAHTDFGKGIYTTPNLQYALWYAYENVCDRGSGKDAVVLVFDVTEAALAKAEVLHLEGQPWKDIVKACRMTSMIKLKKINAPLHEKFTCADVVKGAITKNATQIESNAMPIAESATHLAFRTNAGVHALLSGGCRLLIRFASPHTWETK
jgi:hypothetical protein